MNKNLSHLIKQRLIKPFFLTILLFSIGFQGASPAFAQTISNDDTASISAQKLLAKLSPQQRVGQLFLITFQGSEIKPDSDIFNLIVNHYIGGVVLKKDNDNFIGPENTILEAYHLVTSLQNIAAGQFNSPEKPVTQIPKIDTEVPAQNNYIPLFIGIAQEGDSSPFDQITNGLTPLPNEMAIGATWDTNLAQKVGTTMGRELHLLGFNLLIGPSLDVLDINYTGSGDDLGTRTFGGDPFWVSQMGRAYIKGLHEGSNGQLAVISKNFPGRGGSDRLPESEVATVRKSLDQLKLIELAPFFSVTGNARDPGETTDGLYLSHIRYQGLQGNIRATTKPISLDAGALDVLMKLPEFTSWRKNSGVILSDDLGSQAMRKFYDPSGKTFDARQIVRNAFLAGNDLLYMDRIIETGNNETTSTVIDLLDYFSQKYQEDRAFANQVDAAVERVLTLKFKLYPDFTLKNTLPLESDLAKIGNDNEISFQVASKAITLVSPDKKDLSSALPKPPEINDNILFLSDVMTSTQCSSCKPQPIFTVDEFQKSVLNLYGPTAGGQVLPNHLNSFSFADLNDFLNKPFNHLDLETALSRANWLVFSLLTIDQTRPESNVLHRLLTERPDLIRDKKVIVFSFNTPYRMDATDISAMTAFYGVYSKIPAFVEVAARVLFQEITPSGSSPISIPAVAYDLVAATSPSQNQIIPLMIDAEKITQPTPKPGQTTTMPTFFIGDTIPIRTGEILDLNNHPVPDGTVVKFFFKLSGDKQVDQQIDATTLNGIARTTFRIQDPGMLEIHVTSDPASNSDILLLDISLGKSVIVSQITPTSVPIPPEQQNSNSAVNETPGKNLISSNINPFIKWLISLLLIWLIGISMIWIGNRYFTLQWGLRTGLVSVIFGLIPYLWILLGLPGANYFNQSGGFLKEIILLGTGSVTGILCSYLWHRKNIPE